MSSQENTLQIAAIQTELGNTITFAEMDNTQKRSVIDQLFPNGVALWYTDPKAAVGDKLFGWGDSSINGGGMWFGELTALPVNEANIDFKMQN